MSLTPLENDMDLSFLKGLAPEIALAVIFGYLLIQFSKKDERQTDKFIDTQLKQTASIEKFSGLLEQVLRQRK